MKISKVNHIKAGVSERPIENGGMLYTFQTKSSGKTNDLTAYIETLNDTAKNLYSVFIPTSKKSHEEMTDIARRYFKIAILENIKKSASDEKIVNDIINAAGSISINYNHREKKPNNKGFRTIRQTKKVGEFYLKDKDLDYKSTAEIVVDMYLRKSLRKNYKQDEKTIYIPDVIHQLVTALFSGDKYNEIIANIPREDIELLVCAIRSDYVKTEQIKKIVDSIEKQNVRVQVDKDGEKLILASAYNDKKKYIFDFIKEYAGKDKEGQNEMLAHMHYLIMLYYLGGEVVDEAEGSISAWSFGAMLKERDCAFSEKLLDIIRMKDNAPECDKSFIRKLNDQIRNEARGAIVYHYQSALKENGLSDNDKCWIRFISDFASKKITEKGITERKLMASYLCKKTWEEWLSFVAKKYIEMGKAVYSFALNNIEKVNNNETVQLGVLDGKYKNGISSFDYERLKAEDMLNRGLSGYVSFAVNNFDSSVRAMPEREKENQEDILIVNNPVLRDDAKKRVLRYFGGVSSFEQTKIDEISSEQLINAIKSELIVARNSSFHFITGDFKKSDDRIVDLVFDKEYSGAGAIYRKKFYSNNAPMFFGISDIDMLMDSLYSDRRGVVAQVPSFNKVLSRKIINEFLNGCMTPKGRSVVSDPTVAEKYRNTMYFVLKEIYYCDFIKLKDLKDRFRKSLEKNIKNEAAHNDFMERFDELIESGLNFTELCQEIMTEYNQQNNQKEKKASGVKRETVDNKTGKTEKKVVTIDDNTQIYKHYRTLLYVGLREAFKAYLKEEKNAKKYGFLWNPSYKPNFSDNLSENDFCSNWETHSFDYLKSGVIGDRILSGWYITAHFLDQKNLNHLIGLVKNYVQFIEDIEKRAKATGNRYDDVTNKIEKYRKVIEVLEFAKLYCAQVSNRIEDYFDSKEDYAEYIAQFVDYGEVGTSGLMSFCHNTDANYYDALNPIANRNIVLASLYGNSHILSNSMDKITEDDFKKFRKTKNGIKTIVEHGVCENLDEQRKIRYYQNQKNRLELVDVLTLTELMNDLYGQLVSYSYLRERDLMYMQLGFYYTKLFHTDSIPENDKLRKLHGDCQISDGAILYQIVALYSFDMPLYGIKEEGYAKRLSGRVSSGQKLSMFKKEYCDNKWDIYTEGLNLFEDVDGYHDNYVNYRNYIDHFKYFANPDKSILMLYSSIYDGFFSYDIKLKKSVSYVLPNILLSYFVNAKLSFDKIIVPGEKDSHNATCISIKDVKSDCFTFKAGSNEVGAKKEVLESSQLSESSLEALMAKMNGCGHKWDMKTQNTKSNTSNSSEKTDSKEVLFEARSEAFLNEVVRMLKYEVKHSKWKG